MRLTKNALSIALCRMSAAAFALCAALSLHGATYTWTGGGTPDASGAYAWNDVANWGGTGYPIAGDAAVLDSSGCMIAVPSGGAKLYRIYAEAGEWRMTGGTLEITDVAPFSSSTGTYDRRAALITFDCPVLFSATADKTILSGNIFNNTVTLGTTGRAFFMKGDVSGSSGLTVFSGARTYAFGGNNNICCGKNDGNAAHGGEMWIKDGATVQTKIFFDFAGSVTTVTNGTLTTSASGTAQSLDMVQGAVLNVLAGGMVNCAGRLTVGQNNEAGDPALNVIGGTVTANYLRFYSSGVPKLNIDDGGTVTVAGNFDFNQGKTGSSVNIGKGSLVVGGTMKQGGVHVINFTVPADQLLGSITAGKVETTAAENKINISISDDTLQNGTIYTLITDNSKTLPLSAYNVLYNGAPASEKGNLLLEDGVLTFQPAASAVVWTGEGDGVNFSDAANWNGGVRPFEGCAVYFLSGSGTLVNDMAGLVVQRIQFGAEAGVFTVGGNAIVVDGTVVNRSAEEQTLNCPISAPEGKSLFLDFSEAVVAFAGGATCEIASGVNAFSQTLKGSFTFTRTQPEGNVDNDLWPTTTFVVAPGSTLNIPGEIFVRDGQGNPRFVVEETAVMNVGTYKCRAAFATFDVKGTLNVGVLWGFGFSPVFTTDTSTGTVRVGQVRSSANGFSTLRAARVEVGEGGLTAEATTITTAPNVVGIRVADGVTLGATSDWALECADAAITKFALDVPDTVVLATGGKVVSLRAPVTGGGVISLAEGTVLDLTAQTSCGATIAPEAGSTMRVLPVPQMSLALAAPSAGVASIELVTSDALPAGTTFTVLVDTGLAAADAAKFHVSVPGQDDVEGEVSIVDGALIYTVTRSDAAAAQLVWRPRSAGETSWANTVEAWVDAATSSRTAYIGFSDVVFDGEEEHQSGEVAVNEDVNVHDVMVTGTKDYIFTGSGRLLGAGVFTKDGTGMLTLDGPSLTGQEEIRVKGGTLKLGDNLPANGLGTLGTEGKVTIENGGQIDLNYTSDTSNLAVRNSLLADSLVHAAGEGPDGEGAIVNRGGSATWYGALGRVELDGDTTFGGVSRIDFRKGLAGMTYAERPFLHGPAFTVTSKIIPVGGNYGLFFSGADVEVSNIVVEAGAAVGCEGEVVFKVPGGIELKEGAHFDAYGNTVSTGDSGATLKVGEGVTGALRNNTGTATFNLGIEVASGGALSINNNTLVLAGGISNDGKVVFSGGTQNITAPLTGDGVWRQTAGTVNINTGDVPEDFLWNLDGGVVNFRAGAQLGQKTPVVVQQPGSDIGWGSYEEVNPTMGALKASGGSFGVYAALSQNLPRIDLEDAGSVRFYTDNLETHTRVFAGDWQCSEFFVGGSSRGAHMTAYDGLRVRTQYFHVGNQSHSAPRAIYSLEGGMLEVGAPGIKGMRSQYAPLGTFAFFNNGTLRLNDGFVAEWGFVGVFGRDFEDRLTVDVGDGTAFYRSALGGKASVELTGTGSFFTTQPFANSDLVQDYAEGHWSVGATTNDLSGASAFGAGLSVADGAFARVCIRNDELCEWAHYGTTAWQSLYTNGCQAAWRIANNMNHLHLKLTQDEKAYSNHSFVYRGQFYVEEAGMWTFAGTYDDRIALVVDGKEVFATTASGEVKYGSCELSQGWHDYFIVTEDNSGTQGPTAWTNMALGWTNEVVSSTAAASYSKFAIGEPGLRFRLANSVQWERKSVAGGDWPTTEDYDTITVTNSLRQLGQYSKWGPGQSAANRFSGSFYVSAEQAGEWYFWGTYDDQIRFKVDGVDSGMNGRKDGTQYATTRYNLAEGWHSFEMRTYDNTGNWGPWDGSYDYALGVQITPEGGSAGEWLAFDERNFRFTRLERQARAGIDGELSLGEGSTLANGTGGSSWCPIWGTLSGTGSLEGYFRMKGATWRMTSDGRRVDAAKFVARAGDGVGPHPETLADLGAIEVTFSRQPGRKVYDVCDALGLTEERAAEIPVRAGLEGETGNGKCRFSAAVKDGRLVLVNERPLGVVLYLR